MTDPKDLTTTQLASRLGMALNAGQFGIPAEAIPDLQTALRELYKRAKAGPVDGYIRATEQVSQYSSLLLEKARGSAYSAEFIAAAEATNTLAQSMSTECRRLLEELKV